MSSGKLLEQERYAVIQLWKNGQPKQIFGIHLGHENTHDFSYLVRYIGTASIVLSKMHHAREDLALLEPQR